MTTIRRGSDVHEIPEHDDRAVTVVGAIQQGDLTLLRRLLTDDPTLGRSRIVDARGVARTLLHVAADWPGHFPNGAETVAALVEAGADLDATVTDPTRDEARETPLHWAASSDDVAVLDALLDRGADIEAPGAVFTGGAPMSDAVVFANWRAARRLLERGATTTLWQAAALGLEERVRDELGRGAVTSRELTNALWHACRGGHLAVARLLVDRGADPRWVGYDHKTPLDVARESGSTELVDWLAKLTRTGKEG